MRPDAKARLREHRDLLLLLLLLLLFIVHPVLDQTTPGRSVLAVLMLLTLLLATVAVSQHRGWYWLPLVLLAVTVLSGIGAAFTRSMPMLIAQWSAATAFFAVVICGLFSYVQYAREIHRGHLFSAASIYLLLGIMWYTLYSLIETIRPGSFLSGNAALSNPRSDLMYFSLVTLTTVGYGDIVPVGGVTRILAALEAGAGVLYVAITVAVIVGAHKRG